MDPIDRIIGLSVELHGIVRARMATLMKDVKGMSFVHMHALLMIGEKEAVTMKELANSLCITPSSATSFVDRLVKLGWVRRRHDPKNRRAVLLSIQPKGREMLKKAFMKRKTMMRILLSSLSKKDQQTFASLFAQIVAKNSNL